MLDLYERHLLAGARQERSADGRTLRYLDKCENHFLLATAYAALAELLAPIGGEPQPVVPAVPAAAAWCERSAAGKERRRDERLTITECRTWNSRFSQVCPCPLIGDAVGLRHFR